MAPAISEAAQSADPILLSLFANRFMSIAEAMGRSLQQTAISTNIKERLDFSCALFSPTGDLIANAPHLPVHLGSMSFAVRFQIQKLKGDLHEGDVLLTNHPVAGGSHLPDITCITPVFRDGKIVFFTASRGHHADIGGILAGSMPPTSKTLFEEGASIVSFKVVDKGEYRRDELVRILVEEPAQYPGCSGTRCLGDVESDLRAQIASNNKGVNLINALIDEYSLDTVLQYMDHIRDNAELAVRNLLKEVAKRHGKTELYAIDHLDDGTPIELAIKIDEKEGSAVFDFEGTGPEIFGNLNAPVSVTYSAIIYCLRAMVDQDIPLNQGCLVPITVNLPPGSCLNPSATAAVVGGNVCTSQRVTDVVLKAFEAAAASQGCCNNLTFGTGGKNEQGEHVAGFGYYETIAGGSGAGPHWDGTSGVHVAMTNTRITDPEILERRYPTILHQFSLRKGSGGKGSHRGGDGVIREIEFLEPIQCSILSERRVYQPYGLAGGGPGQCGRNLWVKQPRSNDGDLPSSSPSSGTTTPDPSSNPFNPSSSAADSPAPRIINLGGKATVKMGRGDRIIIETPGGGAWGSEGEERKIREREGRHGRGDARGSVRERGAAMEGA
ncbi:Hydantoinase B/oxoprolinase [Leucosporidium creatinivorum]|uniref:Hydantoinase B/oxoprolinase n=1 Tax=Leucosporidium creatinivorum TaxID=106004 RepID=A0A1Y2G224_9BASI|nr:Hydantoinase B/oxoprolinase [Leucosporidium creatinivorum]